MEREVGVLAGIFGSWDHESLVAMLQANHGNLDHTVDAILQMEQQASDPPSPPPPLLPPPQTDADAELARQLSHESGDAVLTVPSFVVPSTPPTVVPPAAPSSSTPRPHPHHQRGRPVNLPSDFLCLPGRSFGPPADPPPPHHGPATAAAAVDATMLSDAQLAMLLQNELFLRELERADETDLSQLGAHRHRQQQLHRQRQQQQASTPQLSLNERMAQASRALSTMSEGMKRRLNDMAVSFQTTVGAAAPATPAAPPPGSGYAPPPSQDEDAVTTSPLVPDGETREGGTLHRRARTARTDDVAATASSGPMAKKDR